MHPAHSIRPGTWPRQRIGRAVPQTCLASDCPLDRDLPQMGDTAGEHADAPCVSLTAPEKTTGLSSATETLDDAKHSHGSMCGGVSGAWIARLNYSVYG